MPELIPPDRLSPKTAAPSSLISRSKLGSLGTGTVGRLRPGTAMKWEKVSPVGGMDVAFPMAATFSRAPLVERTMAWLLKPPDIAAQNVTWPLSFMRAIVPGRLMVPPTPGGPVSPEAMTLLTVPSETLNTAQGFAKVGRQAGAAIPLMAAPKAPSPALFGVGHC